MRPNQQNPKNRSRGRNSSGRKHVSPLSRNFESNGPDVKIRGNASHIAEKYVQLARDAQASGDSVMAENYLQHAEHYFRILSAAQPQGQIRQDSNSGDDEDGDDDQDGDGDIRHERNERIDVREPQPDTTAAEDAPEKETEGDAQERPRRERRPRRRRTSEAGQGDPSVAPQPDVGELPAFLIGGQTRAAE